MKGYLYGYWPCFIYIYIYIVRLGVKHGAWYGWAYLLLIWLLLFNVLQWGTYGDNVDSFLKKNTSTCIDTHQAPVGGLLARLQHAYIVMMWYFKQSGFDPVVLYTQP